MFDRPLTCLAAEGQPDRPIHAVRPDALPAWLESLPPAQAAYLRDAGFAAASGALLLLPGPEGVEAAVLGLGSDRSPYTHAALPLALPENTAWRLEPGDFDAAAATLGWCLGAYQYDRLLAPKRRPALLAGAAGHGESLHLARSIWLARDLVNTPANLLGPADLAAALETAASRFGARFWTIAGEELGRAYPAIAAVGAGSDRPPVVAGLAWRGSEATDESPLLSLCGKGVVFDSGGYDLKPAAGMLRMKKDMGGAALLIALAASVMAADLPIRLELRVGCVENMVSGRAMRPLDVLTTRKGLTVEVGNTDAEGRLVLCDLLAEACEASPRLLIDAATLTGAARVALGPDLPGLFSSHDELAGLLTNLGQERHDRVWRLPLHDGYQKWLASPIADLNNVAGQPMAGAIVAALFLQRFVTEGTPWIHLDTYAWNDQTRPGRPAGGEALGIRALFAMIRELKCFNLGL